MGRLQTSPWSRARFPARDRRLCVPPHAETALVFPEPLFWWAAAYEDAASAKAFLSRYFRASPGGREKFDEGRRRAAAGQPAPEAIQGTLDFAWSAVNAGVLGADDPI
jgi:hypothetical protein